MVEKVLKLLQRKERWLVVAGVRFLRTCIGTKVGQGCNNSLLARMVLLNKSTCTVPAPHLPACVCVCVVGLEGRQPIGVDT